MKKRVHNFSAGPATLPVEILEAVESELYDYEGIGSSIICLLYTSDAADE